MKKIKILLFVALVGFISYSLYYSKKSGDNLDDIGKVKIGMHFTQVKKIMRNNPFKQDVYDFEPEEFISLYNAPIAASGDITITYNKNDSIVKRIYKGD